MAISKSQPSRPRHPPSSSPTSHLTSLAQSLLTTATPLPAPLQSSLTTLITAPTPPNQILTAQNLPPPPLSPQLQSLACALTAWHHTHPIPATRLLTTLIATLPRHSPALPSALAALAALTQTRKPPIQTAIEQNFNALIPPIHTLLSSQPRALDLLLHLSANSPKSFLPHWALFLPPTNTLISFLAAVDPATRAKAVTIISHLLSAARHLLRNTPLAHHSHHAFTPTSIRALRAARALHIVVADALLVETDGIVLAKLSKLAAQLLACLPYPAASEHHVACLVDALRKRVLWEPRPDLTSRAAGAAALAVAFGKSGAVVSGVENICHEVVALLGENEQPVAELLSVLRSAVSIKAAIFHGIWDACAELLLTFMKEGGFAGRVLHSVRLVETYLNKIVEEVEEKVFEDLGDTEVEHMARSFRLGWELYNSVLREAAIDGAQAVQAAALSAMDNLLRLTDFMHDWVITNCGKNEGMYVRCNGGKSDFMNLGEAIALLQEFALSDCGTGVKIAAIRSLASMPVRYFNGEMAMSVLCCLDDVLRENDNDLSLRGKALSAVSVYMDRVLSADIEVLGEMLIIFHGISVFAINLLHTDATESIQEASAAIRTSIESSRIAAINVIACSLRHYTKITIGSDADGLAADEIAALADVLKGEDSLNTKCICCKAIEQIFRVEVGEVEAVTQDHRQRQLLKALEGGLTCGVVRVQLASAQVLKGVATQRWNTSDVLHAIDLYACTFQNSQSCVSSKNDQPDKGGKRDVMLLQDVLSESLYGLIANASEEVMRELRERERERKHDSGGIADSVVNAVFQYLSFPRQFAEHISKTESASSDSESAKNGRLLLNSLPLESRETVSKVLSLFKNVVDQTR